MSTISETVFEQYDTNPENKALEDMQTEVRDLSRKISSFAKDAAEILSAESVANNGKRANVSLLTKQMFGVVALLTLTLNLGLYFINATLGQMIIANVGISALHVLVSMCVVSDLAKGRTYFQNKREQIQERIQTVSEYLKELFRQILLLLFFLKFLKESVYIIKSYTNKYENIFYIV
jgi:prefoldin subunit 5